jgi:hypothetical protein
MTKKNKSIEKQAADFVSKMFDLGEEKVEIKNRGIKISLPAGLRLGQAISNALTYRFERNNKVNEEPMSVLTYISDDDLIKSINDAHKPSYYET